MDQSSLVIVLALVTFALVGGWMYRSKRKATKGIDRQD